jgi:molybdenum cofactor cytidylyltransferase
MGSPKQLLPVAGRPLLERAVAAACGARLDDVVVVLGANAEAIRDAVSWGRARVVVNAAHAEGMSTSLQAGIRALDASVDRAVVILGDQPDVSAAVLDQLLDTQQRSGLPASALSFDGLLHPPVVMRRELWPDLLALQGDVGCRALIRARPELVAAVTAPTPLHHPVDIDTPDDFERLTADRMFIGSTVINTPDVDAAIAFWTAALGYVVRDADPTFAVLTDPARRWSNLSLQRSDAPKTGFNRVHLDLYTADQEAEVARLEALGATRVVPWDYADDDDHIVMAAPDGNEFCVIQSPYRRD